MEWIELFDEEGNSHEFQILASFEMEERDYIVLVSKEDASDALIYRLDRENPDEYLVFPIEDDDELLRVIEFYENMDEDRKE